MNIPPFQRFFTKQMDQNYQLSHFKTGGLNRRQKQSEDCHIFLYAPQKRTWLTTDNSLQTERPDVSSTQITPKWGFKTLVFGCERWNVGFTSLVSRQVILDKVSEVGLSLPDSCWGPQLPTKKALK